VRGHRLKLSAAWTLPPLSAPKPSAKRKAHAVHARWLMRRSVLQARSSARVFAK
jgi:hypothetical protein